MLLDCCVIQHQGPAEDPILPVKVWIKFATKSLFPGGLAPPRIDSMPEIENLDMGAGT